MLADLDRYNYYHRGLQFFGFTLHSTRLPIVLRSKTTAQHACVSHALLLALVAGLAQASPCDINGSPVKPTISIPATPPDGAVSVPPDFFGFGFESGFVWHFNNNFSDNIVESVNSRMAGKMVIRIGGTSGDRFSYDPKQVKAAKVRGRSELSK